VRCPFSKRSVASFYHYPLRAGANLLMGVARWLCAAVMLLVIIEPQMSVPVDRVFVMVSNAAARLVTYVPISINGIGVLELSAVELFRLGGIPAAADAGRVRRQPRRLLSLCDGRPHQFDVVGRCASGALKSR
jgi:uncharacterized membrane protein YbhN (UPF0104 family)